MQKELGLSYGEEFISAQKHYMTMEKELKNELNKIKKDLDFIKNVLREDFELSKQAKQALKAARKTPEEQYVELD